MKQKNLILIFALIISILILICSVCFLLGYLNFFNITGNVVSSNECTTKGYICGNIDGAGPIVSCSKIAKDYVGDVNLDKACGLSGMAGCCKEKVISAKTVASYTLRGKVWDSSGELMPYVGVKVIGTNAGGMTNEEGIFNINVLENKVYNIELSFVGYKKLQAIISPDNKDYIFRLEEDLIMIDEIVVVGELDEPSPQTETNPSGTNPVKDEGTTPSVISEGSISSSSQTYASILKNKAYSIYGNFPWNYDKFKQDTKDICTKCTSASYCETDKSDSLANSDNYFYNNLYVRASCTDSAGVHFDYCADDKNIVEFGCGNEGSCSEIKKECPGACDGKGGVCEKGAVIFLPDLGKHDTKELAIEDANLEIMSAKKLKEIYKKKGYSVEIIALAQSDENILEVYKNNFEKILNVNESINAVKSSFENNNILLVAFFGHGGRNEEFNIQNYELYRKEGKYNLIEVITFLPGKMEIQHATYNEVGYGASLDKLEKIDFSNISKQIEYYNCGLIDNGGIFAPALPWIVSQREIMEYNDLKNELNKFISGEKSKLSPPEGLKIGEKDKCSCRYETSCPITTGFCPEITDDAGAAKVASGTSAGCSITLNKNQIAVGNKIIEILNKPEFQKQILSTSGYSSMQELDNEVLTGSHNNASSFSMLILEIAVKESTLKHCVNANAKNPFYCETNEASVLKNPDGSGWGVMQVNPKAHGEVINFEKNVKTGVLIFAEAFKSKESDKYCTDSTITRTALRKYNSCNAGSKKYPANVFKYKGVIEEYFPELKKSEDPFIQLIEQANANSQQSCPVAKIAKQTSTQNLKLTIDVYILDDNKKMSDSFNKDPNELLIPILNSVKNYYADIGKDYSLSGVDLTFVIKKGVKTIDRTNLGKDHLALVFTTKQKVEEVFLEDPDRFIYDWLGRRVPTIVQDFEKLAIPGAKKENMELKEFKKKFYWGAFSGPRIGNFGSNNVVASGIGYISYIFPESNNYGESMIINSQSQIIVHEFGHNFGLPHSKEEYLGDKINLMYEFTANPNMPFDNSKFSFSECDVRKILDQLSCSSPSGGAQKVAGGVCTASADVELSCAEDLGGVGKVAANACNVPSFDELKKEEVIKKLVQRYGEERVENVFVTNQKNKLFNKEYILAVADEKTYKFEDIE
ncbi:MAG: carboxypeptidase-like regulatory domain-containing protein, partial [Nanoarchaeota archaeon]|nr:carboxypeptidase-like regulatory domain-containing protein [Nanoarchaeota archaeon]